MSDIATPTTAAPPRRWYQFSLRTLLIVTALAGVACSWLPIKMHEAAEQRAAVKKIIELNGRYTYDYQHSKIPQSVPPTAPHPPGPQWLRNIIGDDFFANVETACLDIKWTDDEAVHLRGLRHLKELHLEYSSVSDDAMVDVAQLQELEVLSVPDRISDAGLDHLRTLHRLRELYISSDQVTDAGLARLQVALPKCKIESQ